MALSRIHQQSCCLRPCEWLLRQVLDTRSAARLTRLAASAARLCPMAPTAAALDACTRRRPGGFFCSCFCSLINRDRIRVFAMRVSLSGPAMELRDKVAAVFALLGLLPGSSSSCCTGAVAEAGSACICYSRQSGGSTLLTIFDPGDTCSLAPHRCQNWILWPLSGPEKNCLLVFVSHPSSVNHQSISVSRRGR